MIRLSYLNIESLKNSFGHGEGRVKVLNGVNMSLESGEMCCVLGESGSGKSTLLNIIGALERADGGRIAVDGDDITAYDDEMLSYYRRSSLGFVFQFYNLVPNLTVLENIEVGEYLSEDPLDKSEILSLLGLTELSDRFPSELSGGQQQRCSIGRALVKNPRLLLCDEPTGALDYATSKEILALLEDINKKYGTTMLIVTHNQTIRKMTHKTVYLKDGAVYRTLINENRVSADKLEW